MTHNNNNKNNNNNNNNNTITNDPIAQATPIISNAEVITDSSQQNNSNNNGSEREDADCEHSVTNTLSSPSALSVVEENDGIPTSIHIQSEQSASVSSAYYFSDPFSHATSRTAMSTLSNGDVPDRPKKSCMSRHRTSICLIVLFLLGVTTTFLIFLPDNKKGADDSIEVVPRTDWTQMASDIMGIRGSRDFGHSVSLSSNGKVIAIGSPLHDSSVDDQLSGKVRVYKYDENDHTWLQLGDNIHGIQTNDQFGFSVSLSSNGRILAVGSPEYDGKSGNARVFQLKRPGDTWEPMGQTLFLLMLDGQEGSTSSVFGYSVSLSDDGHTLAVGSPRYRTNGLVRVFSYKEQPNNNTNPTNYQWVQKGDDILGESGYDYAGYSISLSSNGNIVAIGAPSNDGNMIPDTGHVRVYSYDDASSDNNDTHMLWKQMGKDMDGIMANDRFGYSVSVSSNGTIVAISAPYHGDYGMVQVYRYGDMDTSNGGWTPMGQAINGYDDYEGQDPQLMVMMGASVSLSSDGTILGIGSPKWSQDRGKVQIYQYQNTNNNWIQIGSDILPIGKTDFFGHAISLSSDGTTIGIGAPYAFHPRLNIDSVGRVRVYQLRNDVITTTTKPPTKPGRPGDIP